MLGSQALDTALGLVLLLFVLATAASALLELANRVGRKRARNLETTLGHLLGGTGGGGAPAASAIAALRRTSVYAAATAASDGRPPAYLSAKSFADATLELASTVGRSTDETLPPELRDRLDLLLQESGNDPLELRAGLERWFDEAMGRLSDAYRKQAVSMLGLIGFALAVATNASVPDVAARLWNASVTRAAVVAAAQNAAQGKSAETVAEVAHTTDRLAELAVPLGWVGGAPTGVGWWAGHLLGWGLTAVLVMVGAPFWFELLGRLVTFRVGGSGGQPPRADRDPAAATPRVLTRDGNPAAAPDAPVPESPLLAHVRKAVQGSAP
ncbi:MAG: hypothetical protein ABJA89_08950 [Lapillicoccus sp.]